MRLLRRGKRGGLRGEGEKPRKQPKKGKVITVKKIRRRRKRRRRIMLVMGLCWRLPRRIPKVDLLARCLLQIYSFNPFFFYVWYHTRILKLEPKIRNTSG